MNLNNNFQISTFKRIEEHLNSQEIEKAKQKARVLIEIDLNNPYARTIELWLCEIDNFQKHTPAKQIIEALAQLCRMAIVILKYDTQSSQRVLDDTMKLHILEYV